MGQVNTEQVAVIIRETADAISTTQSDPEPTNYWWLLSLAIVPAILTWWLNRGKK